MFRRQAYYYASVAFLLVSFVYTVAVINQPYIGIELKGVNGQWIVTYSDPLGEGYKSGVRVGDLILKIDCDDPGKNHLVQKLNEVEGVSTIQVRRIGHTNVQMINVSKPPFLQSAISEIPFAIMGFVFWILGFMTWFRRPFLAQARALFWLNWFTGLAIVLAPASSRDLLLAREFECIIFSAVPVFLLNFVSIFQNENLNRINRFAHLLLISMFVIILIVTVMQSTGFVHLFSSLRKLVLITVTLGVLFTLWNLGALIKLPKDIPEKNRANILLIGMTIGFLPFILLTALPIIFSVQPIMDAHVSSLFVSTIPMTWYFVVVNKYLPDSRRFLSTIISNLVAIVIISIIVSYLYCTLELSNTFDLALYLSMLALLVVIIVCFNLVRVVISKLIDNYLFSEGKCTFKKLILKLNESLSTINEENQMLEEVAKNLAIEGAFIVVEDGKGGYLKNLVGSYLEKPSEQAQLEEFFQDHQKKRINLDVQILPDGFPAELYIPIISNNFTCGIFFGHRYSQVKFERDELPLITLISSQLAQRLITTLVIKELSKEIKDLTQKSLSSQRRNQGLQGITTSLFRSLEKERKSIANEIHDGPLQLGLDLNRWLKYLVEECPTDTKTGKAMSHMQEVVENLNFELRLICNDLRPPALAELGLLSAIELMCKEIMLKELLLISLETEGISPQERFAKEVELAAYRFLQEGITNTVKHSGSNRLNIHIEMNEDRIEMTVRDWGKGFDTSQIEDWSLMSVHFGMVVMKERLENLGGALQISSTIGQGTILKATIPIA